MNIFASLLFLGLAKAFGYKEPAPVEPPPPAEPPSEYEWTELYQGQVGWTPYPPVSGIERPSPQGWIDRNNLTYHPAKFTVHGKKLHFGYLADTNSMDGYMDYPHLTIGEIDFDRDTLRVGDIVTYHAGSGRYIIHQITGIEEDEQGRLYTLQGTNNSEPDSYLVRNEHIYSVLIGILYTKEEI